jgi:tetratricopeptide (TPR) repeat protein
MAEITLKAYYAHLDDLLGRRAYEEVAAHSQHILGRYPQNLEALRRLGKARLESGQSDEASRAFVNVLRLAPFDADAFIGLGEVAQRKGVGEQAIYYLERAYEQEPTSAEAIGRLRDAHRQFSDRANAKLPTTPLIAARQQVRTGLEQQAIQTLSQALEAEPNRIDFKLAQARIYAQSGDGVNAVRSAMEVLKQLPECLEANEIVAKFWIAQGRPSDARRFVEAMENVDPIRAYEIASGRTEDDDRFVISLLNFHGTSEVANTSMDWLDEIGGEDTNAVSSVPAADISGGSRLTSMLNTPAESADAAEDSMDWLTDLSEDDDAALANPQSRPAAAPEVSEVPDWLAPSAPQTEPTGEFAATSDADVDPFAWLDSSHRSGDSSVPAEAESAEMDWLDAVNAEESAPHASTGLTGLLDELPSDPAGMDWPDDIDEPTPDASPVSRVSTGLTDLLKDHRGDTEDAELEIDFSSEEPALDDFLSMMIPDDSDPEVFDDTQSFLSTLTDGDDPEDFPRTGFTESLRMLDETEDEDPAESTMGNADPEPEDQPRVRGMLAALMSDDDLEDDSPDVDDMAGIDPADPQRWLREGGYALDMLTEEDGEPAVPQDTQSQLDALSVEEGFSDPDDPFNWAAAAGVVLTDEPTNKEVRDFLADPMGVENNTLVEPASENPLAWIEDSGISVDESQQLPMLDDEDEEDSLAWARAAGIEFSDQAEPVDVKGTAALSQLPDDADSDQRQEDPTLPARPSGLLGMLDVLSARNTQQEESEVNDAELPEWMRDDEQESGDEAAPVPQEEQVDWLSSVSGKPESTDETEIDWEGVTIDESASDEAPPDWLVSLEGNRDDAEYAALSASDDPASPQMWEGAADEDAVEEELPEWMKTLRDEPQAEAEGETVAETDAADDGMFAEADMSAQPEPALSYLEEEDIPSEPLPFDTGVNEPIVLDAGDDAPAENAYADAPTMQESSEDEMDELFPKTETAMPAVVGEVEDWGLSESLSDEDAILSESSFDLGFDASEGEEGIELTSEDMDWLTALDATPADELDSIGEDNALEPDFALDFLEEDSTSDVPTIDLEVEEMPGWLVESKPDPTDTNLDVDVPAALLADQEDLFGEVLDDKDLYEANKTETDMPEIAASAAVNAPDWLNALVPGVDNLGGEMEELEEVSDSDFLNAGSKDYEWINEIVEDEFSAPIAKPNRREARFAFDEPPVWLQRLRGATQPMKPLSAVMDADGDDLPDWLNLDEADQA